MRCGFGLATNPMGVHLTILSDCPAAPIPNSYNPYSVAFPTAFLPRHVILPAQIEANAMELATLLGELIAIPSVNPMGRQTEENADFESRLTDYLEKFFRSLRLPVLRQVVAPRRDNILARCDPPGPRSKPNRLLLIEVHQDTVPVDSMQIEPFTAKAEGTRIYGRGACDVKGGMAAVLMAIERLVEVRSHEMPTVVVACTVNEEHGFTGASQLTKLWTDGALSEFLGKKPDACIVIEPTELQIVVRHKGVVRWKCHTAGKAAHSSQTKEVENAIYRMSHVLQSLEAYNNNILPQLGHDDLCGGATLSVGTVTGGVSVNTIADRCTIEIDRRLMPDESPESAYQHAVNYLKQLESMGIKLTHDPPMLSSPGLGSEQNDNLARRLLDVANESGSNPTIEGVPYGTNAGILSATGVPTVVFGPGSIKQAHTANEWIDVRQIQEATETFFRLASVSWQL